MLAELKRLESGGRERDSVAEDAHHRDPGLLQRSLDARDADALPRAPPGPDRHRHRICRPHQQLRRRRRLHRGALGRAVVRLDGRLRRRPAVPLPDGRARAADRSAEISAAAHRHAQADRRPWRLLRLHLLRARRRRLPDVRHHADADLRSQAGDQLSQGLHVLFQAGRHREVQADRPRGLRRERSRTSRPDASRR